MSRQGALLITGTRQDAEDLINRISRLDGVTAASRAGAPNSASGLEEPRIGEAELVTLLIEFTIGLGAHATYDLVVAEARKFRAGRRHVEIRESDPPPDSDDSDDSEDD